jgi:hypothetical protein
MRVRVWVRVRVHVCVCECVCVCMCGVRVFGCVCVRALLKTAGASCTGEPVVSQQYYFRTADPWILLFYIESVVCMFDVHIIR